MNEQKKSYTMEDNIKYISFGVKDLVKELQRIATALESLVEKKDSLF